MHLAIAVLVGLSAVAVLAYAGFVQIESGTVGAVYFFGRFYRIMEPGPQFYVPGIERVEIISTATVQFELPDEPENIDRLSDIPPPGKRAPFRIIHPGYQVGIFYVDPNYDTEKREGNPFNFDLPIEELKKVLFKDLPDDIQEAFKNDPFYSPVNSEVTGIIEYGLKGKDFNSLRQYIENVSPRDGRTREQEVRKRIEDVFAEAINQTIGKTPVAHANELLDQFNHFLKERVEVAVGEKGNETDRPWGLDVVKASIKPLFVGRTLASARSDAAASVSKKQSTIREAEGKAEEIKRIGEAEKVAQIAKGQATRENMIDQSKGEKALGMAKVEVDAEFVKQVGAEALVRIREAEAYRDNKTVTTYVRGPVVPTIPLSPGSGG